MFYHISGSVAVLEPNLAVIDCGGVGFEINTSMNTISRLKLGERAKLFTYTYIREDAFDLYGFDTLSEKRFFEMLISVSGVGPKAALSILSANTPENIATAIIGGDEKALTIAQGIGKRIAQRVILELKDKVSKETQGIVFPQGDVPAAGRSTKLSDAAAALAVLGCSSAEITAALRGLDVENLSVEDIVRETLKNMLK